MIMVAGECIGSVDTTSSDKCCGDNYKSNMCQKLVLLTNHQQNNNRTMQAARWHRHNARQEGGGEGDVQRAKNKNKN